MSETLSQLPTTAAPLLLSDGVPITAGYAGPNTGTTFIFRVADILGANGTVYAMDPRYGMVADSNADNTTPWQNALAAAFDLGGWVVGPPFMTTVSSLSVPDGVGILGRSPGSQSSTVGPQTLGTVIKGTSTSAPALTLGRFGRLQGVQISGNNSQPCISIPNGYSDLFDTTCFGGSVGVSYALVGGNSRMLACRVHDCSTAGILNPFDTTIDACIVTGCGDGVRLTNGSHNVRIDGGKFSGNNSYGISADGTGGSLRGLLIAGAQMDANGNANMMLRAVSVSAMSACGFARGGQGQAGTPGSADDCNIYLQNCSGVTITGNTSRTGFNDAGAGYNSPFYAVFDGGGNVNCIIALNILPFHNNADSATTGPINSTSTFNLNATLNQTFWS